MKNKLLILYLFVATTVYAESITIKQKSGNETIFELSTNPVITFIGEDMVVTNDFTTISLPLDDIDSYVVGETLSAIQEVTNNPQIRDGHVVFKGLKKGGTGFIYSLDGKTIGKYSPDSNGIIDINMRSLSKGTYVISTPNSNIKYINR